MHLITLTDEEMKEANEYGGLRSGSKESHWGHQYPNQADSEVRHIRGVKGEIAVARWARGQWNKKLLRCGDRRVDEPDVVTARGNRVEVKTPFNGKLFRLRTDRPVEELGSNTHLVLCCQYGKIYGSQIQIIGYLPVATAMERWRYKEWPFRNGNTYRAAYLEYGDLLGAQDVCLI